jgi:hypothetical protein
MCCASLLTSLPLYPHINRDQVNFKLTTKKNILMCTSSFMENPSGCQNLLEGERHADG